MEKQEIEKIKTQIEKAQKYLLSFSGNERKTYAVKQRIFKLKDKIGDTSPTYQRGPYGPFVSRQFSSTQTATQQYFKDLLEFLEGLFVFVKNYADCDLGAVFSEAYFRAEVKGKK